MNVNPYLFFNRQCAEAFELYARVLGGKTEILTHSQSPMADQVPADWRNLVMHGMLTAGGLVLMGSDECPPENYQPIHGCAVTLNLDDPAETDRIFNAFAEGGNVISPLQETFFAQKFGMLTDRFGVLWMMVCICQMES